MKLHTLIRDLIALQGTVEDDAEVNIVFSRTSFMPRTLSITGVDRRDASEVQIIAITEAARNNMDFPEEEQQA